MLATILLPSAVAAQVSPDEIVRRDLIQQAEQARSRGDHAQAVERGVRAQALRATPSIRYFLAREYEALGQPLDALGEAGGCVRDALADPGLRSRDTILQECRAMVMRAEAGVGRVTVRFATPLPPGVTVQIAGNAVAVAALGVPYPVAPGPVRINVDAPAYETWQHEVSVAAGASLDVDITLQPTAPPVPVTPPPQEVVLPMLPPPSTRVPRPAPAPSRGNGPWIVGATGLVSFAAAGVLYGLAVGAQNTRNDLCPPTTGPCNPSSGGYDARYRGELIAADVAVGVGAAALVGGVLWWWLARPRASESAPPVVRLFLVPMPASVNAGVIASW